jgi:hypothetical protein
LQSWRAARVVNAEASVAARIVLLRPHTVIIILELQIVEHASVNAVWH